MHLKPAPSFPPINGYTNYGKSFLTEITENVAFHEGMVALQGRELPTISSAWIFFFSTNAQIGHLHQCVSHGFLQIGWGGSEDVTCIMTSLC